MGSGGFADFEVAFEDKTLKDIVSHLVRQILRRCLFVFGSEVHNRTGHKKCGDPVRLRDMLIGENFSTC